MVKKRVMLRIWDMLSSCWIANVPKESQSLKL